MFHEHYVQKKKKHARLYGKYKIKHQNISHTQLKFSWKDINLNNELK